MVKYGCQPRPTGCAISAVLVNTSPTVIESGVNAKYWVASNAIHMADPAAHGLRTLASGESYEAWMKLDVAVL